MFSSMPKYGNMEPYQKSLKIFGYKTAEIKDESEEAIESIPLIHGKLKDDDKSESRDLTLKDFTSLFESTQFSDTLFMRSDMYFWQQLICGIFYLIPTVQLVLSAQRISHRNGSQSICYYNYLCRTRIPGVIEDFGHIFSNIGYILSGVLLIVLVFIRKYRQKQAMIEMYCQKTYPNEKID